jgi:hypothetical protein
VPITTVRCTTLCDKVYQWLATGRWFSPGPPVSSTNKSDCHDITKNIVESGIKHHQTNKQTNFLLMLGASFTRFGQGDQSTIFMFYSRHYNFVSCYRIYLSKMTTRNISVKDDHTEYICQRWPHGIYLSKMTTRNISVKDDHTEYICQRWPHGIYLSKMTTQNISVKDDHSYVCHSHNPSVAQLVTEYNFKTGLLKQRKTLEEQELLVPYGPLEITSNF